MPQAQPAAYSAQTRERMIDIEKFNATPLSTAPYEHIIVPGFIRCEAFDGIVADYPDIKKRGSFPLNKLNPGPAFTALLEELKGDAFRAAVGKKFNVDLTGKPLMITVRGICGLRDGKIHTDTESKILSLLLYMNPSWEKDGGRLRLLKSENIDDVAAEIPPAAGTVLVFRRADNSWHGHKPYAGPRKVIQLNWVSDQKFVDASLKRHALSAWFKKLNPFAGVY